MKILDMSQSNRYIQYNWFKSFKDSTYSCNSQLDVTKLVRLSKERKQSFFVNMLYIVSRTINSIDEMKMRLVDDQPVIFETTNPAFTVMTNNGAYQNARQKYTDDYDKFYTESRELIEETKNLKIKPEDYNQPGVWDDIYITCVPWVTLTGLTHPIPENQSSQCIPRICWSKYFEQDGKILINFNITASHIFVDGYPMSKAFLMLQDMLDNAEKYLK